MEDSAANGEATKAYIAALESSICTVDELLANPKAVSYTHLGRRWPEQ